MNGGSESPDPKEGEYMASYDYRVFYVTPGTTAHVYVEREWTSATAVDWAHIEGRHLPEGTRMWVERRRRGAAGLWLPHRRYQVSDRGITQRQK